MTHKIKTQGRSQGLEWTLLCGHTGVLWCLLGFWTRCALSQPQFSPLRHIDNHFNLEAPLTLAGILQKLSVAPCCTVWTNCRRLLAEERAVSGQYAGWRPELGADFSTCCDSAVERLRVRSTKPLTYIHSASSLLGAEACLLMCGCGKHMDNLPTQSETAMCRSTCWQISEQHTAAAGGEHRKIKKAINDQTRAFIEWIFLIQP